MPGLATRLAAGCAATLAVLAIAGCGDDEAPGVPAAPPGFFGMMVQSTPGPDDYERMAEAGVGRLRIALAWNAIDPGPGPGDLDFTATDAYFAGAAANGIAILPYLYSTPDWLAAREGADCAAGCATDAPGSPEGLAAWREFVATAVDRYGPQGSFWAEHPELEPIPVRDWQIWNEQNSPSYYTPAPDVEEYAALLGAATEEIRARDPGATVILGGMAGSPLQGRPPALTAAGFLRRLYEVPGARESFDGVAAHPYAARLEGVTDQLDLLRGEIGRAGDEVSLWVTEIGWSAGEGDDPLERGLEGQAENLTTAYEYLASERQAWDIRAAVWYAWRDNATDEICSWCAGAGLFEEAALTAKPSADAYAALPRSG